MGRYYRRNYYKKQGPGGALEGLLGLYILYLISLWFTNKPDFWRWLSYGVGFFALIILFIFLRNRISENRPQETYNPNWGFRRKQPTSYARKLGNALSRLGWKTELEKWDGHKHIDIAITDAKTNIEVDGSQHNLNSRQALSDMKRDFYSSLKGFITKRVPNSALRDDESINQAAKYIDEELRKRVDELKK